MNIYMKDALRLRKRAERKTGVFMCEECWIRPAANHSLRCPTCLEKFGPSSDGAKAEGGYYFNSKGEIMGTY